MGMLERAGWKRWAGAVAIACAVLGGVAYPDARAQAGASAKEMIAAMMANEDSATERRDRYQYVAKERSERTGGHLWTEKVIETSSGKVRLLVAEDGQPLSADRAAAERARLAAIVADPAAFAKKEQGTKNDEQHAKEMLRLLPKAYLFGEVRREGGEVRMDYTPDPAYQTQSMEERVLHGMSGTVVMDAKAMRLKRIDGKLPEDVTIGFGFLATVRAGSSFTTARAPVGTDQTGQAEWKTVIMDTNINGKAAFFKTLAKNGHAEREGFERVPKDLSVATAVEIIER